MTSAAHAGLFITGTDTGVGKTFITAAIAWALRHQGVAVRVCKPVATGAEQTSRGLIAEDTRILAEASGETDLHAVTPWTFSTPAAPPVAARLSGIPLHLEDVAAAVRRRMSPESFLLVEGVGGLLCPLTEATTVADLIAELALPVVVVTRRTLGTLNHTLLTLEAARLRQLQVCGLVVNETEPVRDIAAETNVAELQRLVDVPVLGVVSYRQDRRTERIEGLAEVDWLGFSMSRQVSGKRPATEGRGACRR
jgi:dethiobiotin synthetase